MICKIYKQNYVYLNDLFGSSPYKRDVELIGEFNFLVLPRVGEMVEFVSKENKDRDFRGEVIKVEHIVYEGGIGGDFNLFLWLDEDKEEEQ